LEGIPAIIFGVVTIFYLTDWPREAKWLPADERDWITEQLNQEKQRKEQARSFGIWEAFRHRDVILLTLCYFFAVTGNYGIGFWLPTILRRLSGHSDLTVTLLAALPYLAGFVTLQLNAWHSDRKRERRWHAALPLLASGLGLALAVYFGANTTLSVAMFTLVGASYYPFIPVFWTVPTMFLTRSAAAASIGLINSVGNLGGFVGPTVMGYLVYRTHSFAAGLLYLVGSFLLATILMLAVGTKHRHPVSEETAESSAGPAIPATASDQ
jgi:ACS family tartrate transporter-like MFS transporter